MHASTSAHAPGGPTVTAAPDEAHLLAQEERLLAARQAGDATLCADIALELARAYARLGNLDVALARVESALDVLEHAGLRHRLGAAHVTHALISFYRDRP